MELEILAKKTYEFVDFLVEAEQKNWQVLPLGITSFGDSPTNPFLLLLGIHIL